MALSKDDILNAIAEMSVMEVVELVSAMEEKFGVSAAAAVAVAPAAAGDAGAAAEEKDEFEVVLSAGREESERHQGRSRHHRPRTQRSQGDW
jgi:large subunit ribosomal protein L7/L12